MAFSAATIDCRICWLISFTAPGECDSGYCIFSGLSGYCSRACNGMCPPGWSCYSVPGAGIDPGQVVDVCVKESNQLCTPCTRDDECAAESP